MLQDCYLLTNNKKDFFDKKPISENPTEYTIHADLLRDTKKMRGFPSFKDFYKIILEEKINKSQKFEKWLKEAHVDERYVFDLLRQNDSSKIENAVVRTIEDSDVDEIYETDDYYFSSGYVDVKEIEWRNCENIDIEIIEDDACIISCILNLNVRLVGHKYDPGHLHDNDKYFELDEKDLTVHAYISFYLREGDKISDVEVDNIGY